MNEPDDLPARVSTLKRVHLSLRADVEEVRTETRQRDERIAAVEEDLQVKFSTQTRMLQALADTQAADGRILRNHSEILAEHGEMLREHSESLRVLRKTQIEQDKKLSNHGRMLSDHGRMLSEHGRMLSDQGSKLDRVLALVTRLVEVRA